VTEYEKETDEALVEAIVSGNADAMDFLMNKYKNFFALIKSRSNSCFVNGTNWYTLQSLPETEPEESAGGYRDYPFDYWKWTEKDFSEVEYHCSHCGKKIEKSEMETLTDLHGISDNYVLCEECAGNFNGFEEYYGQKKTGLEFYENLIKTSSLLTEDEKEKSLNALSNVETCVCCGEIIFNNLSGRDREDRPVCDVCRNRYYYCEHCNVLVPRNEYFTGANGGIYCSVDCVNIADPFDFTRELAYNAKPPLTFLGSENKSSLFMGVEVEIDGGDEKADCIYELSKVTKDIYCKHDGSLDYGFEFVTHPATLSYHKNSLKYDELISVCQGYNFKSHDMSTTGLHVHVNRKFFSTPENSDECALKLEILTERFWGKMLQFARRTEDRAARWAKRRNYVGTSSYNRMNEGDVMRYISDMKNDRYTAINTTNSNTIEFRLFKGTMRKETIFATLEFVDLLCRFVKGASLKKVTEVTWEELIAPINKTKYKEMKAYMIERGLLTSSLVA
jgi:hypothetical protein